MIDLITLHAHHKQCRSCGRFDNYIYARTVRIVRSMYFKNVVHTTITANCPYCGHGYVIETITERTD